MSDHQDPGDEVVRLVELDTDEGREGIPHGPGPAFLVAGVTFVPAELLAEES
ncbi:hypothetical protein [Streptomyces sp. NBC_01174]|uniref:hypothetical protein n=1 Tax=Streptomyces sp. NBC_01174 TaxID=2903758 RepID=UPI002F90CDD3|nr:hypothetical protein OG414_40715 [Streptomyces sp. NBC_01174]